MKFTQIPSDTFQKLQLNAGILVSDFTPSTGTISGLIGATSGGVNFTATPTYSDFGDGIDNAPKNVLELKRLESWDVTMSGSFITVDGSLAKKLVGAGDSSTVSGATKITPRNSISSADFDDIWWVGDYSDKNGDTNGGYVAIHMLNGLSTGGFQIQSADKAKGTFAFTFTGHYSINAQTTVPFEVYVKTGSAEGATGATGATGA